MKAALASVISASESALSDWNRMTKTSAVLRKLSLNAAKNWHQNSGANRLDNSRGDGMPSHYCKVPYGLLPEKKSGSLMAARLRLEPARNSETSISLM